MVNKKISFKKRLSLNLFRQIRSGNIKLHELSTLFWEATLRCNLNCKHCGSDCLKDSIALDMPLNEFLDVLKEIKGSYDPKKIFIAVLGGEPLMRNDLEDCGKAIRELGFNWGTVTNGMLVTEKRLNSLINAGLSSISVSLDGLKESHNWMRNHPKSYEKAVDAIKLISAKKNILSDVITCVHQRNINELDDIKSLLIKNGVTNWRIFNVFPKGRAKEYDGFKLDNVQFKSLMEFITSTKNEGKINVDYACEGFLGNYEGLARKTYFNCVSGINIASIMIDGSISGCLSCRRDYIQGNIKKDSFVNLWENGFEMMRDRKWMKNGICTDCKVFKWCNGNGLHLRDSKTDELENCHYRMIME